MGELQVSIFELLDGSGFKPDNPRRELCEGAMEKFFKAIPALDRDDMKWVAKKFPSDRAVSSFSDSTVEEVKSAAQAHLAGLGAPAEGRIVEVFLRMFGCQPEAPDNKQAARQFVSAVKESVFGTKKFHPYSMPNVKPAASASAGAGVEGDQFGAVGRNSKLNKRKSRGGAIESNVRPAVPVPKALKKNIVFTLWMTSIHAKYPKAAAEFLHGQLSIKLDGDFTESALEHIQHSATTGRQYDDRLCDLLHAKVSQHLDRFNIDDGVRLAILGNIIDGEFHLMPLKGGNGAWSLNFISSLVDAGEYSTLLVPNILENLAQGKRLAIVPFNFQDRQGYSGGPTKPWILTVGFEYSGAPKGKTCSRELVLSLPFILKPDFFNDIEALARAGSGDAGLS